MVTGFSVSGEKQRSNSQFVRETNYIRGGFMGYLTKKGELRQNWNTRFSILLPSRLIIYFTDETLMNFKGKFMGFSTLMFVSVCVYLCVYVCECYNCVKKNFLVVFVAEINQR